MTASRIRNILRPDLLVGPEHFQLFAGRQFVAPFTHLLRGTRGHLQTLVELAVAGFNHGLVQVTLCKVAGEMVWGQICRQCARLPDRSFAIFPRGFVRSGRNSAWGGQAAAGANEKA
jgi:hypothetical protein